MEKSKNEELARKLKLEERKNQDYNRLNVKYNQAIKEKEQLEIELEKLKYKKRTPLSPSNHANTDNPGILGMLKQTTKPMQSTKKPESIYIDKENQQPLPKKSTTISMSSSQNHDRTYESSDLAPTQFTMDGDELETHKPTYQKPRYQHYETFDPKDNIPIMEDSIDLRVPAIEIPPSSPTVKSEALSQDLEEVHSSPITTRNPIKVKKEETDSLEIVDSQDGSDDLNAHFPTPKTATKFQTPFNIPKSFDMKKSLLHTPDDLTPMKKAKKSKTMKNPILSSSTKKFDFTNNPKENREWIYEDFKIDPSKNDNYDYAYDAVLRGAERRCQHGKSCKNCENFYKIAKGDQIKPGFAGPQWNAESSKLNGNQNIISKSSRHRTIWDREASPPGFGDFDFPNTQQQKENKEKSLKIRRNKAYKRLFSALNNGKYLFKDNAYNEALKNNDYSIDESVFSKYITDP